jgi:hypothetical protein
LKPWPAPHRYRHTWALQILASLKEIHDTISNRLIARILVSIDQLHIRNFFM